MTICKNDLWAFAACLRREERSSGTVEKYRRDAAAFAAWLGCRELTRETAARWRDHLLREGYAPATINSMLSAVNALFRFLGREDCKIKFLRVQRKAFEMTGGNITGNTAGSGGGIFCGNNSTLQLTTSESEKEINISDNVSGGHGGGIFSSGKSSLMLDGVNIERNQAGPYGFGGAVFAQTSIDINNTTMRDNTAGTGSAVRVHGQGNKVSISNSVIENTAASEAFIISAGPNAEIFLSKTTLSNGNAIAAEGGSLTMEDTTIKNGSVSLDRYPDRVASFESNGFKVQIDGKGNVSITDADGNAVEAVLDAKGEPPQCRQVGEYIWCNGYHSGSPVVPSPHAHPRHARP